MAWTRPFTDGYDCLHFDSSMASKAPPPQPSPDASWRRWLWLVDLVLAAALWLVATRLRLAWDDLIVVSDVPWFVHSSNAIALGQRAPFLQLLYTSVPCGVFALLIRLFQDPIQLLHAWAAVGALSAPVAYLAVRRLAGPAAGLAAGLLLALSTADVALVTGIKSPYVITLFSGAMVLGLAGATQRRSWGVPLMVFGSAMAVAFHLGLWPIAPLVCVFAVVHLLRLPRRQALAAGAISVLLGGAVVAWIALLDLEHLAGDLEFYRGAYPSQAPTGALTWVSWQLGLLWKQQLALAGTPVLAEGIRDMYFQGLSSTPASLRLFSIGCWLGLAALLAQLGWCWRRSAARNPTRRRQLTAGLVGLQAWLLLLLGSSLYLRNAWLFDYLQYHHLVALLPMMLVAIAGLLVPAAPARAWLWWILPTALLAAWLGLARDSALHDPRQPPQQTAGTQASVRSTRVATLFATAMRDHAQLQGTQPGMVLWGPWGNAHEPWLFAALANSFARLSWNTEGLPQACYLATTPRLAHKVGAGVVLAEQPNQLVLLALDDCQKLRDLDSTICDTLGSRAWRADPSAPTMDEMAWLQDWLSCPLNDPIPIDPNAKPPIFGH